MLLEVNNLDISYGSRLTVSGVSFTLEQGRILSIVGESGSGKTTVIRAIMGCLPGAGRVSGGSIVYDGKDVLKNTPDEWRSMSGREMSMIFQDSGNMINPIRRIGSQFIVIFRHMLLKNRKKKPTGWLLLCWETCACPIRKMSCKVTPLNFPVECGKGLVSLWR